MFLQQAGFPAGTGLTTRQEPTMPKYRTELFGQLIYSPDISYEDLLPLEEDLMSHATEKLEAAKAHFIHFESEGDRTFFQCVFREFGEELFASVAKSLAVKTDGQVECKLFFVDKELSSVYFYALSKGRLKANKVALPVSGPIDKTLQDAAAS